MDAEDQKLDSLRPGSREGQNFQLGSSAPGRRRIYKACPSESGTDKFMQRFI